MLDIHIMENIILEKMTMYEISFEKVKEDLLLNGIMMFTDGFKSIMKNQVGCAKWKESDQTHISLKMPNSVSDG